MVYVNSRGEIIHSRPVHQRVVDFFYGIFAVIMLFFRTLLEPLLGQDSSRTSNYRPNAPRRPNPYGGSGLNNRRIAGFGGDSSGGPSAPPCASGG